MSRTERIAVALTRRWVAAYTSALPPEDRDRRRIELESDLWEQQREGARATVAASTVGWQVLQRLVTGIPADLEWRFVTGGAERRASGLLVALLAAAGFQLAFLRPGVPDLHAPGTVVEAFYAGKTLELVAGHILIWLSAAVFLGFVWRTYRSVSGDRPGWLARVLLGSGLAASLLLCGAFACTAIAAWSGRSGNNLELMRALYPLGGLIFHVLLSGALALFLASTVALGRGSRCLPSWAAWSGAGLAVIFVLEAAGAGTVFLLPQALLLVWLSAAAALFRGPEGDRSAARDATRSDGGRASAGGAV